MASQSLKSTVKIVLAFAVVATFNSQAADVCYGVLGLQKQAVDEYLAILLRGREDSAALRRQSEDSEGTSKEGVVRATSRLNGELRRLQETLRSQETARGQLAGKIETDTATKVRKSAYTLVVAKQITRLETQLGWFLKHTRISFSRSARFSNLRRRAYLEKMADLERSTQALEKALAASQREHGQKETSIREIGGQIAAVEQKLKETFDQEASREAELYRQELLQSASSKETESQNKVRKLIKSWIETNLNAYLVIESAKQTLARGQDCTSECLSSVRLVSQEITEALNQVSQAQMSQALEDLTSALSRDKNNGWNKLASAASAWETSDVQTAMREVDRLRADLNRRLSTLNDRLDDISRIQGNLHSQLQGIQSAGDGTFIFEAIDLGLAFFNRSSGLGNALLGLANQISLSNSESALKEMDSQLSKIESQISNINSGITTAIGSMTQSQQRMIEGYVDQALKELSTELDSRR